MVLFFFSSRRRHTRWTGDWSSDVCSSDLHLEKMAWPRRLPPGRGKQVHALCAFPMHHRHQWPGDLVRLEEHTSELQSPVHLVCRLLLEKKNAPVALVAYYHDGFLVLFVTS